MVGLIHFADMSILLTYADISSDSGTNIDINQPLLGIIQVFSVLINNFHCVTLCTKTSDLIVCTFYLILVLFFDL